MGQQQLLLLVFGVVVVGVAVVASFFIMDERLRQNTVDNLLDRNLTIASEAVFWKSKKDPYYGGDASYSNLTFSEIGAADETPTGRFDITHADGELLEITAVSSRYPEIGVRTYINGYSIDSTAVAHDGSITID